MNPERSVSFILATHNRRATLLRTLERIDACGLPAADFEILVVDNASTDDTATCVRQLRPDIGLTALQRNLGPCAKDVAIPRASGRYVVFLDDDSFPLDDAVPRMIERFEAEPRLGCTGFMVHLQNGSRECSALPSVFVGCGAGFRRQALQDAGGYDRSFFMAAEEYDLAFRLAQAGWAVRNCSDLHVLHLKTPAGRYPERLAYFDMRNNMVLAAAYLPAPWHRAYQRDWSLRYRWLAEAGTGAARQASRRGYWRGLLRGNCWRLTKRRQQLRPELFHRLFGLDVIDASMARLRQEGRRRLLLADLGKNIFAFYWAARRHGLELAAVLDDTFACRGRTYRGLPIMHRDEGLGVDADAIVISNSSEVHGRRTELALRQRTALPVMRWHGWVASQPSATETHEPEDSGPCNREVRDP